MKRALVFSVLLALSMHVAIGGQQAGQNVNVLPVYNDPDDPDAYLKGNQYLQRQLEPTVAASTRNPNHLLAFFIDYRAVDIASDPGLGESTAATGGLLSWNGPIGRVLARLLGRPRRESYPAVTAAAEAWIGMSRSYDGGATWTGGFLPGAPFDQSPASLASPVWGLEAATDPVLLPAPCGRFYLVFLAFTRGGQSMMAVARYVDLNNREGGDTIQYLGTTVIESANNATHGVFIDKPSGKVDAARGGSGDPCAHNVYVSYTTFNGQEKDGKFKSKVTFARSTNGGLTFSTQKLNMPFNQNQGTAIAVDPRPGTPGTTGGGTVYLMWRHFFGPDDMLIQSSTNFGQTFSGKPVQLLAGSSVPQLQTFDQPTRSTINHPPEQLSFRSNAFPTITVSESGMVLAAWQERVDINPASPTFGRPAADGSPRIVAMRSLNGGATWTDLNGTLGERRAVDFGDRDTQPPAAGLGFLPQLRPSGPQVMPYLDFGGGRLMLLYYESRGFMQQSPESIVAADVTPPAPGFITGLDRLLDVRAALLHPQTGALLNSVQVSRYPLRADANLADGEGLDDVAPVNAPCAPDFAAEAGGGALPPCIRRVNRTNVPHSASGTSPFMGDYVGATPAVQFVPTADGTGWRWATSPSDVPYRGFHAVFTDNRNQIPPTEPSQLFEWERYPYYAPPGTGNPCLNAGSRNGDVLTARIDAELIVSAPTTFKQLEAIQRAFPFTLTNGTAVTRFYRLAFATPQMANVASFSQTDPSLDTGDVEIFPFSSSSRVVYIDPAATGAVTVTVREIDGIGGDVVPGGASGSATFNADPSNPAVVNAEIGDTETHNPFVQNPFVQNPFVQNSSPSNPFVQNPFVQNPFVQNSTIYDITDVTWTIQNVGNTNSSYLAAVNLDNADAFVGNYAFQLIISKTSSYGGLDGCSSMAIAQDEIISNVVQNPFVQNPFVQNPFVQNPFVQNPFVQNPFVQNSTLTIAPADGASGQGSHDGTLHAARPPDTVKVTLRAYQLAQNPSPTFDPSISPPSLTVAAQSRNIINGVLQDEAPVVGSGPDLAIASGTPVASPGTVQQGQQVTFPAGGWTLINQGNLPAVAVDGTIEHAVYLSPDDTLEGAILVASAGVTIGSLEAGATQDFGETTFTIPPDIESGSYNLFLVLDDGQKVSELNELNNISAPVPLAVALSNVAPVAHDQSVITAENTPVEITIAASDANNDPLTFTVVTAPSHGVLSGTAPQLTYTPDAGYAGPDSFTFMANDGEFDSNVATVSITVTPMQWGFSGLLSPYSPPPSQFKIGNSVPLKWRYLDAAGVPVPSSHADPEVDIQGPFPCNQPAPSGSIMVFTPGNSDITYVNTDEDPETWRLNWATGGLEPGCYGIFVISHKSGQTNGPFLIRLRK